MRVNPIVERATEEHLVAIAPKLRGFDAPEIAKVDALAIMRAQLAKSEAWTWLVDGEPACIFGFAPRSVLGGVASVWIFTTDAIHRDRRAFWLGSKRMVAHMRHTYPTLECYCDARFLASLQWLRRLGFAVAEPFDFMGVPFRYCVLRGDK